MTQLHPYLSFEKAKDAIEYYEDVFGATNVNRLAVGEEQAENFGLTKDQADEATMHAEFEILGVKSYVLILLVAWKTLIMEYHY